MQIIIYILFLTIPIKIVNSSDTAISTKNVSKILYQIFENKKCVYLVLDYTLLFLQESLVDSNMSIISLTNFTYYTQSKHQLFCKPTGYIISMQKVDQVRRLLNNIYNFIPHTRLLLLISEDYELEEEIIKMKNHGMKIFVMNFKMEKESPETYSFKNLTTNTYPVFINKTVKIGWFPVYPFFIIKNNGTYDGLEFRIFSYVCKDWPLLYIEHERFNWTPIIQEVKDEILDIIGGIEWDFAIESNLLDGSFPYLYDYVTLAVPKSRELSPRTFVFQPMQYQIWLFLVIVAVTLILTINIIDGMNSMTIISVLLNNSTGKSPEKKKTKLLLIITSIFTVLISTAYSAGFISIGIVPRLERNIKSFSDILESNLKCYQMPYTENYGSNKFYQEIAKQFVIMLPFNPPKYSCSHVELFSNKFVLTFLNENVDTNHLKIIPDIANTFGLVFGFRKNSPYKKIFDRNIKRLIEHGFISAWYDFASATDFKMMTSTHDFFSDFMGREEGPKRLNFVKLQGIFWILVLGESIALIVFVVETIITKYKVI